MSTIDIITTIILAIIFIIAPIVAILFNVLENKIKKEYQHIYIIVLTTKDNVEINVINKYFKTKEDAIIYAYNKNYKNYYITMISKDI